VAVDALTEKMLGVVEFLLGAVEANDAHESLIIMLSSSGDPSGALLRTAPLTIPCNAVCGGRGGRKSSP
jgi:hypothetical protein